MRDGLLRHALCVPDWSPSDGRYSGAVSWGRGPSLNVATAGVPRALRLHVFATTPHKRLNWKRCNGGSTIHTLPFPTLLDAKLLTASHKQ